MPTRSNPFIDPEEFEREKQAIRTALANQSQQPKAESPPRQKIILNMDLTLYCPRWVGFLALAFLAALFFYLSGV